MLYQNDPSYYRSMKSIKTALNFYVNILGCEPRTSKRDKTNILNDHFKNVNNESVAAAVDSLFCLCIKYLVPSLVPSPLFLPFSLYFTLHKIK